jgi:hypothetical protein
MGVFYPQARIDGVELDPDVTAVGRRYFGLDDNTRLHVITADARPFLRRTHNTYDLIIVDAYRPTYVPFYLATQEFFRLARSRLAPGGAVVLNVGSTPDDHRLGDVNQGWSVALTTLMNERASIGGGGGSGGQMARIFETVRHFGLDTDPVTRQKLADLWIHLRVASYTNQRAMDRIKSGQLPGPEMSIAKLALTQNMQQMAQFVAGVLGPKLVADQGEWGTYSWSQFVLGIPGMRIAGGSDEVMRNIVGERVLGLPKDAGIDSTTPFRDLKVGTQNK